MLKSPKKKDPINYRNIDISPAVFGTVKKMDKK